MARLPTLGISVMVLIAVVVVPILFSRALDTYLKIRYGDKKKEWYEKQGKPVGIIIVGWLFFVGMPAIEEVMFRSPIIFFFSALSPIVWMVIIVTSLVFGLMHVTKNWFNQGKMVILNNEDLGVGMKIWRFSATSALGFILSYQAVLHHSLYRCFWIHLAWNVCSILILPIILPVLEALLFVLEALIYRAGQMAREIVWHEREPSWGATMRPGERIGGKPLKINLLPPKKWLRQRRRISS